MRTASLLALPLLALASPLAAQDHDHSAHAAPAPAPEPDSVTHDHSDHAAMDHSTMDHSAHGASPPPASTAAPSRAAQGPSHAADTIWGSAAMAAARAAMVRDMGGEMTTAMVLVERLEARLGAEDGYKWDVQAHYGGDLDRLVLKSEGEGEFGGELEDAEVQALWSHAIGPWFDLQAGARLDLEPDTRSHLALGVQGLVPYMGHVDAAAFLSDRGDLTARVEAEYDQKITQRLILQPRVEAELSAQDIAARDVGAGLVLLSAGLRLRYEIAREFAPYVGVEHERLLGRTRRIARANGDDPASTALVLGARAWF
jgi:copper resistance protein B